MWNFLSIRSAAVLVAIILCCAVAPHAVASATRAHGLGGRADYFEDDSNVLRWYGSLADYPNLVVMESGHVNVENGYEDTEGRKVAGPAAGIHLRFDQAGKWGTGGLYFHGQSDASDPGSLHRSQLGSGFSGLYCVPVGQVQIGLMARHSGETRFQGAGNELIALGFGYERSRTDLGLGVRFDLGDRAYLDLAGDLRNIRDRAWGNDPANPDWSTATFDSWDNYGLRARGFVAVGESWVLAPLLEYISEDFTGTGLASGNLYRESSANDGRLVRLGAAVDYYPNADAFLVMSADFLDGRVDHQLQDLEGAPTVGWVEDYQVFCARIAYEVRVAFWMTLRAATGFEHVHNRGTVFTPRTGAAIPLSLGAGLNFNTLILDIALTDREPRGLSAYSPDLAANPGATWLSLTLGFEF